MSPPPKRARTSSSTEDQAAMDAETPSNPKKRETLWFEDGNIVLASDVHLYCVHRGVLARNSTVFKDMLELPNVGDASNNEMETAVREDSWEGKPLVRMVGDGDEDVYHLLMTLYDIEFYSSHRPTTLPIILSLIRMSTKYNFSGIRNAVTTHLEHVYPNDLCVMEDRNFSLLFEDFNAVPDDFDLQLLVAALKYDMKSVLPMLYLECSTTSLDTILKASERLEIEKQHIERILHGRERMIEYSYQYGIKRFAPKRQCSSSICSSARLELLHKYVVKLPHNPIQALLRNDDVAILDELRESICKACSKAISATLDDFRLEIWDSIPKLYGLGTWEDTYRD
ncbi:hypothetical protein SCHPADRAFT_945017 [Schizopora paradoxa]|uniref:BTB domain-containing protein n=1 Tax=Schizopora paradoxa TaxID=27342 RepID=A0A0H2R7D0_9AGAM|nr:hypothetical protein SCHPADRAFT_945017 [Schizopora paradoxa]